MNTISATWEVWKTPREAPQVLVVDDDDDIRGIMREVLATEGYSSAGVANGKLALDWLQSSPGAPALILLDLMMPQMDGLEFLRCIHRDDALGRIPVALMSADPGFRQAFETHRARFATRFAQFFLLPKPVDLSELLGIVADVVPTARA